VEALLAVTMDIKWAISGGLSRSYIEFAEWKEWKQWCRTSIPGLFAVEGSTAIDNRHQGWAVEFQDV